MSFILKLYPRILNRYLLRSFITPFLTGVLFFTFIHLLFYLKEAIKAAVEKGIPFNLIFDLLINSTGWTISITIPMSILFAVIISISGLNADTEITAMRAGGVSYYKIFNPLLYFGLLITILLIWFNFEINPNCFSKMRTAMSNIYQYDPIAILEKGQFTTLDKTEKLERHVYIEDIEKNKDNEILKNIQIRTTEKGNDKIYRLTQLIIARKGIKIQKKDESKENIRALRLYEGYIFLRDKESQTFQRIDFHKGSIDINIYELPAEYNEDNNDIQNLQSKKYNELISIIQLDKEKDIKMNVENKKIKKNDKSQVRKAKLELHKRIALSFAALTFIYLGFPIGITNKRSGKGIGLGISIVFIFLYYILFLGADSIIEKFEFIPTFVAAWSANIFNIIIGFFFYRNRIY
ncbi:MAG: LptF/LptG family permease [Spirochaetia bacterium]|nr:LptF/LptG family permease [Spirochaetia bacterium]